MKEPPKKWELIIGGEHRYSIIEFKPLMIHAMVLTNTSGKASLFHQKRVVKLDMFYYSFLVKVASLSIRASFHV